MNQNFIQQMISAQINKGHATSLKERLVRLMKMCYVSICSTLSYDAGLEKVYNDMKKIGVNEKALGDLKVALDEMREAGKHFDKAHEALMNVWGYAENKEEISKFTMTAYGTISDIIENAVRCTPEGKYKSDFTYLAMIPQDELKDLNNWYRIKHSKDGKVLDVI